MYGHQVEMSNANKDAYLSPHIIDMQLDKIKSSSSSDLNLVKAFCSPEELDTIRRLLETHLIQRVHTLCKQKNEQSAVRWCGTQFHDDRSHEQSLYWELVFASQSAPIDQYAFQLTYYLMEYQSKRYARNCAHLPTCKTPGRCVLEGSKSPCKLCTWLNAQVATAVQVVYGRSEPSGNHWTVDIIFYMFAATSIAWIAVLSMLPIPWFKEFMCRKWMLHVVQEILYQTVGFVYSTERIELFFRKWYNRLAFGLVCICVQFTVLVLTQAVNWDWKRSISFGGLLPLGENTSLDHWLLWALVGGAGLALCTSLSIVPTEDDTNEQKKHLDVPSLAATRVRVMTTESNKNNQVQSKPITTTITAKNLLLLIVSQDQNHPHDAKRICMMVMTLCVAFTSFFVNMYFGVPLLGTCEPIKDFPDGQCWFWPLEVVQVTRALVIPISIPCVYTLQSVFTVGLPYVWRKQSIRDRYLALVKGDKAMWVEPKKSDQKEEMKTLDFSDRDTLIGFGMVVNLLESSDSTEKRRTEATLGILTAGCIFVVIWAILSAVLHIIKMSGVDGAIMMYWTGELFVLMSACLIYVVLPNGIKINQVPAELNRLMIARLYKLIQQKSIEESKPLPPDQNLDHHMPLAIRQMQMRNAVQADNRSRFDSVKVLRWLITNFEKVVFVKPFALLGLELTVARFVGFGTSLAAAGVTFVVKSISK